MSPGQLWWHTTQAVPRRAARCSRCRYDAVVSAPYCPVAQLRAGWWCRLQRREARARSSSAAARRKSGRSWPRPVCGVLVETMYDCRRVIFSPPWRLSRSARSLYHHERLSRRVTLAGMIKTSRVVGVILLGLAIVLFSFQRWTSIRRSPSSSPSQSCSWSYRCWRRGRRGGGWSRGAIARTKRGRPRRRAPEASDNSLTSTRPAVRGSARRPECSTPGWADPNQPPNVSEPTRGAKRGARPGNRGGPPPATSRHRPHPTTNPVEVQVPSSP